MLDRVEAREEDPAFFREWTLDEFETYVASRPSSSANTARMYRADLRRLEEHDEAPVPLHPPDEDAWRRHIVWRKQRDQLSAVNRYRASLVALVEFLEVRTDHAIRWPSLASSYPTSVEPFRLPPDDVVPEFWQHTYFPKDKVRTKLVQYVFRFGFLSGVRPPSEIAVLRLPDLDLEDREVWISQPKKDGEKNHRPGQPVHLMTAGNAKSLRRWIEDWRPRLEPETDHVFPHFDGGAWPNPGVDDPFNALGSWLRTHGRKVWDEFTPYTMRHWFATTLMRQSRDVHLVADELGDTVQTVDGTYVDRARARSTSSSSWTPPPLGFQEGSP
jgi:integrase